MNPYYVTLGTRRSGPNATGDAPQVLRELLEQADVRFNGGRRWDPQVHDAQLYERVLRDWSLGFGEAYVDGAWDCEQLDELFTRLLRANIDARAVGWARLRLLAERLRHGLFNLQSMQRAFDVGRRHYDAGNDVFERMLDSRMIYSCGWWERASTLEQAQFDKLDLICRKLELKPGQTLLDIGCGWGGLARFAAERCGVHVTGITVSKQQLELARERCKGLPVTLYLRDYRDLHGEFDNVVSVGMFEHVGPKNHDAYFSAVKRLLKPQGLFLLHTIGLDKTAAHTDPWIDRYVFPNGRLPSVVEIARAVEGRFIIEDWHAFGPDYDRTLMAWAGRFERAWPQLKARYDERFHRMWRYYLLSCAALFRSRQGHLWQIVMGGHERRRVYRSVRSRDGAPGRTIGAWTTAS